MSEKVVQKYFSGFRGIDWSATSLNRDPGAAITCDNLERSEVGALVTRHGFNEAATIGIGNFETPRWGLYNYKYRDIESGEEIEELLGFGDYVYRLNRKGQFCLMNASTAVVYAGIDPWVTWVGPCFRIVAADGTVLFSQSLYMRDIDGISTSLTLGELRDAINAAGLTGISCYLTPSLVVSGAQTGRDYYRHITCRTGLGESLTFDKSHSAVYPISETAGGAIRGYWIFTDQAAATASPLTATTFSVADGDEIGVGHEQARVLWDPKRLERANEYVRSYAVTPDPARAPLYMCVQSAVDPTVIGFDFWQPIPTSNVNCFNDGSYPLAGYDMFRGDAHNYVCVTKNNVCYIATPFKTGVDIGVKNSSGDANQDDTYMGCLKYDGVAISQVGVPMIPAIPTAAAGVAGAITGTVKAMARICTVDAQFGVSAGNDSLFFGETSVTLAAQKLVTALTDLSSGSYPSTYYPYIMRGIVSFSAKSTNYGTATFSPYLIPGSVLRIGPDSFMKITQIQTTSGVATVKVYGSATAISAMSLNIDYSPTGYEIYRTKASGETYYLSDICAHNKTTFSTNTADSALVIEYEGTGVGELRHDPPSPLHTICEHQGLLCGIPGSVNISQQSPLDNTMCYSSPENPEYWPPAQQMETGSESGRAIVSVSDSLLVVFRDDSYYRISGGLIDLSMTGVEVLGGIGCPSALGVVVTPTGTIFMSKIGVFALDEDGEIVEGANVLRGAFVRTLARFKRLYYEYKLGEQIAPHRTIAAVDQERHRILFSVTKDTTVYSDGSIMASSTDGYQTSAQAQSSISSYTLAYDLLTKTWTTISGEGGMSADGGIATSDGDLFILCRRALLKAGIYGALLRLATSGTKYDFADNGYEPISHCLVPQWDYAGDPRRDKEFSNLIFFRTPEDRSGTVSPEDPYAALWSASSDYHYQVFARKNFDLTNGDEVGHEEHGCARVKQFPLRLTKATAFTFEWSGGTSWVQMRLDGYQYSVKGPFGNSKPSSEV